MTPLRVFISYDKADEAMLQEFEKHLATLKQQKLITTWDKRSIEPGTNRADAVRAALDAADLVLLLLSSDYIAGDAHRVSEERDRAAQKRVIPILVRPCLFEGFPFGLLQQLPRDKAVTQYPQVEGRLDEAWVDVVAGIREVVVNWPGAGAAGGVQMNPPATSAAAAQTAAARGVATVQPAASPTQSVHVGSGAVVGQIIQQNFGQTPSSPARMTGGGVASPGAFQHAEAMLNGHFISAFLLHRLGRNARQGSTRSSIEIS